MHIQLYLTFLFVLHLSVGEDWTDKWPSLRMPREKGGAQTVMESLEP